MPDTSLPSPSVPSPVPTKSAPPSSTTPPAATAVAGTPHSPSSPKGKGPASSASPKRPTTSALLLDQYVTRDHLHAVALAQQHESDLAFIRAKRDEVTYYHTLRAERARNPGVVFGYGYAGYGNGFTDGTPRVLYPCQRKRPGGRKARELRLTRQQVQNQAEQSEMLVPVRLDIDFEKIKLRDTFTWNLHDRTVPLDLFVEQLVEDFHLPLNPSLLQLVTSSIRDQVTEFHPHVYLADEPLDPMLPYTAYKNDDMRVLIKLNITIGQHTLVDQFEWDINNPLNSPEEFAQLLTREMSLSGEFTTAIAHSIREQCQLFTRALFVTSHPFDGRPVEDEDVRSAMLQSPIPSIFRPHMLQKDFTPLLYELSEQDIERAEKSRSRDDRRVKRLRGYNRRGGPTIPDLKEMPKTHRTQIVSSILPGAVQKLSELERTMVAKPIKDGEDSDSDSDSDIDAPPERIIPGFNNMTKRQQRMAAMNAAKTISSQTAVARSQTPEIMSQRSYRHETPKLPPPTPTPTSLPPPPLPPRRPSTPPHHQTLPRRPGAPPNAESALLVLRIAPATLRRALNPPASPVPTPAPAQAPPHAPPPQTPTPATGPSPSPAATPNTSTPNAADPPAPPEWLTSALNALFRQYPHDRFEGTMRWTAFDAATDQVVVQNAVANHPADQLRWRWMPRIRCHDCPGKLYQPGPEQTVENFLTHLKNRGHRERVEARVGRERSTVVRSDRL